jgi:hypothetical protein
MSHIKFLFTSAYNTHHFVAIMQDMYKLAVSQGALASPYAEAAACLTDLYPEMGIRKILENFNPFSLFILIRFFTFYVSTLAVNPRNVCEKLFSYFFSFFLLETFFFSSQIAINPGILYPRNNCFMAPTCETHFCGKAEL